jgi:ribosomal protein S18 acetylase RimI-like enzyme
MLVRMHHELDPGRFFTAEGIEAGYGRWLVKEHARGQIVLVAVDAAGAIVGYAYATVEERDWNELLDAHGKLHDVFVDPSARRGGIARQLVGAVVAELARRGAPRVVLSTAVKNEPAQALFRSLGFAPTMIEMTKSLG